MDKEFLADAISGLLVFMLLVALALSIWLGDDRKPRF